METRPLVTVAAVVAVVSCTGGDASTTTTALPATTEASPTSIAARSATTVPATTAAPTRAAPTTVTPTTVVPTTTLPGAGAVAATCSILQTGTWPERRAVLMTLTARFEAEGGTGPLADAVRAGCPDDLARQEAAIGLEQRAAGADLDVVTLTGMGCEPGSMRVTLTNGAPEAIGIVVAGHATTSEVTRFQSGSTVWSLPPGASQQVRAANAGLPFECRFVGQVFLADETTTDAGTPGAPGPATTGDDPATWLPALLQARSAWTAAPAAGGDADHMDLRALARVEDVPEPGTDVHPVVSASVCPDTAEQPRADRMAFAYAVEYGPLGDHPPYWDLSYGAFRRGTDGRWRFLTDPLPLDGSLTGANCAPPIPHP